MKLAVVLGGELGEAGELVLESLRARVRRSALAPAAEETRIVAGELGVAARRGCSGPRCSCFASPKEFGPLLPQ